MPNAGRCQFAGGDVDPSINARVHSAKTPRRSYAKGFESVCRVGHYSTPLVAY